MQIPLTHSYALSLSLSVFGTVEPFRPVAVEMPSRVALSNIPVGLTAGSHLASVCCRALMATLSAKRNFSNAVAYARSVPERSDSQCWALRKIWASSFVPIWLLTGLKSGGAVLATLLWFAAILA